MESDTEEQPDVKLRPPHTCIHIAYILTCIHIQSLEYFKFMIAAEHGGACL